MTAPAIVTANKLNLLGLVGAAAGELGLKAPVSVVNNVDPQAIQFLALAKREGKDFYQRGGKRGGWQELHGENIFTTNSLTTTGTTVSGAYTVTNIPSTASLAANTWSVASGTGIAANARIVSVDSATQVTFDQANTASGTATAIIFGQDTYSLPNDFSYFQQMTWWDRSYRWQMMGPLSAQEWQVLKSGLSPIGPRRFFRIMGNQFYIHPAPSVTGNTLVFEYYSNAWCQSSGATAQNTWAADTDYYSMDDDCFILGLKWRYKAAKGLDYTQEKLDYEVACDRLLARNGGNRDLKLNAQSRDVYLLNSNNIPDTGYGVSA